jgi:hypothetical protein
VKNFVRILRGYGEIWVVDQDSVDFYDFSGANRKVFEHPPKLWIKFRVLGLKVSPYTLNDEGELWLRVDDYRVFPVSQSFISICLRG